MRLDEFDHSNGTIPVSDPHREPPPPRPTWPTWVELVLCSGYPTQLLVSYLLITLGFRPQTPDGQLSGSFVFALSLLDTVLLLSLIVMFIRARGQRVPDHPDGSGK